MKKTKQDQYEYHPDPISRSAKPFQCHKCHAYCFRGLDHDRVAGIAIVDSRPLNAMGELIALLQKRETYDLAWRGWRYEIDYREVEHIVNCPPGSRIGIDVVVQHVCGQPIIYTEPLRRGGRAARRPPSEECPF